jgi:hypothetical protein
MHQYLYSERAGTAALPCQKARQVPELTSSNAEQNSPCRLRPLNVLGTAARAARLLPRDQSWRFATRPARCRRHGAPRGECCRAARPTDRRVWNPSPGAGQNVCDEVGRGLGRTQGMAGTPQSVGAPYRGRAAVRVFVRLSRRCLSTASPEQMPHARPRPPGRPHGAACTGRAEPRPNEYPHHFSARGNSGAASQAQRHGAPTAP